MSRTIDVKAELTQSLKYLHLPTVRQCYEEVARQAERESLSYERYLHELVRRECEERQETASGEGSAAAALAARRHIPGEEG